MCLADPSGNPRPNRIINLLGNQGYKVDVLGYPIASKTKLPINKHVLLKKRRSVNLFYRIIRGFFFRSIHISALLISFTPFSRWFIERYLEINYNLYPAKNILKKLDYDILIVEHLYLLPFAFSIQKNAKIIFDAKEYFPREFEHNWRFRLFESPIIVRLCQHYLTECDHLITVSPGLAKAYKDEFGVDMQLIRSTPLYQGCNVQKTNNSEIKMVHHGGVNRDRGIENMIEIARRLDERFTLDLYLVGCSSYIEQLKQNSADCHRIRFMEPVLFNEIIPMLNQYDIGIFFVKPITFNLRHCLPNKLFEFIQSRLAVAIGPSPDMADLVHEFQCGFIAPEFTIESMIETLQRLTPDEIDKAKQQSDLAAQTLCYEKESEKLLKSIDKIMSI